MIIFFVLGHHDVIDLLAFNSADVNKKTPEGWTPLFVSALRGDSIRNIQISNVFQ